MRIVNIPQRSPEWHRWRANGVTASEAPVILGRSPYKTPWRLWAEKTGLVLPEDLSNNPHVQRGIALEPKAREAFERRHDELLLPICAEADHAPLLRASFDGINSAGEPVELKCPSPSVFAQVRDSGEGSAPYALYWAQVQHQILVADSRRGWLAFYCDGELIDFPIPRDDAFLQELEVAARTFWQQVQTRTEPAKDPERDCFVPQGETQYRWTALARQYREAHGRAATLESQLKAFKADMRAVEEQLLALMDGYAQGDYAGIRLSRYWVNGAVDYRQLVTERLGELDEAKLARYRKAPSERIRVTVATEALIPIKPSAPTTCEPLPHPALPGQQPHSFYF